MFVIHYLVGLDVMVHPLISALTGSCVGVQVNPTVFTLITFPFLFAVMFGDFAHGFMMLLFALLLILREKSMMKQQLNDMIEMLFGGRYVILLMALFSMYVGLIYNEAFSLAMTVFGQTKWYCTKNGDVVEDFRACHGQTFERNPGEVYPFGVDPIWRGAKNELTVTNSIKMKMSILLGVAHMDLGVMMSLFNQLYFWDHLSVYCEFIPQILFLNGLFGYLCFMLLYKWTSGSRASLYSVMIDMFLKPGTIDDKNLMGGTYLFAGQGGVQVVLVLIAFFAVPWMLIPKPFILRKRHRERMVSAVKNKLAIYLALFFELI